MFVLGPAAPRLHRHGFACLYGVTTILRTFFRAPHSPLHPALVVYFGSAPLLAWMAIGGTRRVGHVIEYEWKDAVITTMVLALARRKALTNWNWADLVCVSSKPPHRKAQCRSVILARVTFTITAFNRTRNHTCQSKDFPKGWLHVDARRPRGGHRPVFEPWL